MSDRDTDCGTVLRDDMPCVACGYNLRTLTEEDVCPECAAPVLSSVSEKPLSITTRLFLATCVYGSLYLGLFLVLPYHFSGRAWYDYGWDTSGTGPYSFDPKNMLIFDLPVLGPLFEFAFVSAPIVAIITLPCALAAAFAIPVYERMRHGGIAQEVRRKLAFCWWISLSVVVFFLLNARNVLDWWLD